MTVQNLFETDAKNSQEFIPVDALWRVTVDQYHAMIDSGALTKDNPIELLQGWLVQKMPKKPKHSVNTRLLFDILSELISSRWFVNIQEPITTEDSEPEPDLAIVKGKIQDYFSQHPQPTQIALLIEVSDATLKRDRTLKKQLYASAAIPIYWVVNLPDSQIEVYSSPFDGAAGSDYKQQQTYGLDEAVPVLVEDQIIGKIVVNQLFLKS